MVLYQILSFPHCNRNTITMLFMYIVYCMSMAQALELNAQFILLKCFPSYLISTFNIRIKVLLVCSLHFLAAYIIWLVHSLVPLFSYIHHYLWGINQNFCPLSVHINCRLVLNYILLMNIHDYYSITFKLIYQIPWLVYLLCRGWSKNILEQKYQKI